MENQTFTYKTEFADFDAGQDFENLLSTMGQGWSDSSFRNDVCPSICFDGDVFYIQIFMDYTNPELSEIAEYGSRFAVALHSGVPLASGDYMPELSRDFEEGKDAVLFARIILAAAKVANGLDLDSICEAIQTAAGQTDGGVAGLQFACESDGGLSLPEQWADVPESERLKRVFDYAGIEFAHVGESN